MSTSESKQTHQIMNEDNGDDDKLLSDIPTLESTTAATDRNNIETSFYSHVSRRPLLLPTLEELEVEEENRMMKMMMQNDNRNRDHGTFTCMPQFSAEEDSIIDWSVLSDRIMPRDQLYNHRRHESALPREGASNDDIVKSLILEVSRSYNARKERK